MKARSIPSALLASLSFGLAVVWVCMTMDGDISHLKAIPPLLGAVLTIVGLLVPKLKKLTFVLPVCFVFAAIWTFIPFFIVTALALLPLAIAHLKLIPSRRELLITSTVMSVTLVSIVFLYIMSPLFLPYRAVVWMTYQEPHRSQVLTRLDREAAEKQAEGSLSIRKPASKNK